MKVRGVFHEAVACLGSRASLARAAALMDAGGFGSVAIYEDDKLVGIITETDLVRAIAEHRDPRTARVADYMSRDPVVAGPDESSDVVAERMVRNGFRHLPVVENGKPIGMVSARDLLQLEAWPPRRRTSAVDGMTDHPVRPRRRRLIEPART